MSQTKRIIDRYRYYDLSNSSKLLKSILSLSKIPLQSALGMPVREKLLS